MPPGNFPGLARSPGMVRSVGHSCPADSQQTKYTVGKRREQEGDTQDQRYGMMGARRRCGELQGAVEQITSKKGLHSMAQHFLPPTENKAGTQATILVIENDWNNRILLEQQLSLGGYNVVSAMNGQEALELLDRGVQVDMVLTDLSMPVLNGYQAAQLIRARAGYHDLPIVAVTGYEMSQSRSSALENGCNEYLTKPVRQSELLEVVARLLPARKASGG